MHLAKEEGLGVVRQRSFLVAASLRSRPRQPSSSPALAGLVAGPLAKAPSALGNACQEMRGYAPDVSDVRASAETAQTSEAEVQRPILLLLGLFFVLFFFSCQLRHSERLRVASGETTLFARDLQKNMAFILSAHAGLRALQFVNWCFEVIVAKIRQLVKGQYSSGQ